MTSTRLARGSKGRIFIYVSVILLLVGIFAVFHNTQQQFHDLEKTEQLCQHQQESLLAQMQVIIEYKARLEKSLQTERASHLQSLNALETKVRDEKALREKHDNQDNARLTALQQHYKLLKTQHEHLEEECASVNGKQLSEISELKKKVEELTKELKLHKDVKYETLQKLQNENKQLTNSKNNLQNLLNKKQTELEQLNDKLQKEIYHLHKKLDLKCDNLDMQKLRQSSYLLTAPKQFKHLPTVIRDFSKQIQLNKNTYQIRTNGDKPINQSIQNDGLLEKLQNAMQSQNTNLKKFNTDNIEKTTQDFNELNASTALHLSKNIFPISTPEIISKAKHDKVADSDTKIIDTHRNVEEMKKFDKDVPAGVLPIPAEAGDSEGPGKQASHNANSIVKNSLNGDAMLKYSSLVVEDTSIEKENVAHEIIEDNLEKNNEKIELGKKSDGIQNNAEEDMYDKQFPLIKHTNRLNGKDHLKNPDKLKENSNGGGALGVPELYEEEQREMALEEPDEDDDVDDYGHDNKNDLAVRN